VNAPQDQSVPISHVSRPAHSPELVPARQLLLLRHTHTEWSETGLYQGQSDPPLSRAGIERAEGLASELAPILAAPVTILTSPLARARMTADLLTVHSNKPVTIDERLTELDYGAWEGHSQETVKLRWPDMLRQWKRTPDTVCFPSGGSLQQVQGRLRSLVRDIASLPQPVLAVTHDGLIRVALLEAMGLPLAAFRSVKTEPGGLTRLLRSSGNLVFDVPPSMNGS